MNRIQRSIKSDHRFCLKAGIPRKISGIVILLIVISNNIQRYVLIAPNLIYGSEYGILLIKIQTFTLKQRVSCKKRILQMIGNNTPVLKLRANQSLKYLKEILICLTHRINSFLFLCPKFFNFSGSCKILFTFYIFLFMPIN